MNRYLAVFVLAVLLPPAAQAAEQLVPVDRIVAVVNKDVVTQSELDERVAFAERELRRQGTPLPDRKQLEHQVLERLILEKAQLQLAHESGLKVEDAQLDAAIGRIAERNKMSVPEFRAALEHDGVNFDKFRDEVRNQILLAQLREREVDDKIEVSNAEVERYLQEHKADAEQPEYELAHILVRIPDQASPEQIAQARERAEKARAEAVAGGDFGKIAATYSDASDALQGGAIGWRAQDRLPDLFVNALKTMKPGDVSPVMRSPAGFHVIKLIARREAAAGPPVMQTHVRQILIKTNEVVSADEARRKLLDLRQRIVLGHESFAKLARQYSEDPSAANGGDIGWVYPGDTVPEFERAMDALKPGEVSEPVKTPFGWHLIEVLGRRVAPVGADRLKLQARQVLRERKADEAYQEWLRQLRDRTYVQIRLDDK
ncbi:MAG: peptidylprolyl isomerase [Betaproteobacteria bacterium]|nr:peptidylprolyl isomerase [Betaproteobacteria bacterium]